MIFKLRPLDCKCNAYVYKSKDAKKITKNLAQCRECMKYRNGNPVTIVFLPTPVLTGLEFKHLLKTGSEPRARCFPSWNPLLVLSSRVHGWLVRFIRTAFL